MKAKPKPAPTPALSGSGPIVPAQDGVRLLVHVQPRAARDEISGVQGEELKIRVQAPPVDSAANQAVLELIAERLGCHRRDVQLVRGASSRHKILLITGLDPQTIASRLGLSPSGAR